MTYQGKFINDKNLKKVSGYLKQWLADDEEIIALFRTTQMKPQTDGLVLTNYRILTVKGIYFGDIKLVNEIVADDIAGFSVDKGFGKAVKLFVDKKDSERVFIGNTNEDYELLVHNFLPKMSGSPKLITDKMNSIQTRAGIQKEKQREMDESHKVDEKAAKTIAKQERKAAKVAMIDARGKKLGYVFVKYVGGYDPQFKKTFFEGFLNCYENEVEDKDRNIKIPADQIVSFEIMGKEQTNSRISVTRIVTLGVFSLAAPKRSTKKEASIYISLKDGRQIMFHTDNLTESDVHRKLANAISHYRSMQAVQTNHEQPSSVQGLDVAGEIAKFADLRKQGILTDDEFEAKKKQLLNI